MYSAHLDLIKADTRQTKSRRNLSRRVSRPCVTFILGIMLKKNKLTFLAIFYLIIRCSQKKTRTKSLPRPLATFIASCVFNAVSLLRKIYSKAGSLNDSAVTEYYEIKGSTNITNSKRGKSILRPPHHLTGSQGCQWVSRSSL